MDKLLHTRGCQLVLHLSRFARQQDMLRAVACERSRGSFGLVGIKGIG